MRIKKSSGKIYGAEMTAAEKKAMDIEIRKQLADYNKKHSIELDSLVLWILHTEFGFGETRLKRFYDRFGPAIDELTNRYLMEEDESPWLCTFKLKEIGIDIEKWHKDNWE